MVRAVSMFPPPLWGPRRATLALEVRERGSGIGTARVDPSPQPSPARGEGAHADKCLSQVGLDHTTHLPAAYLSAGQRRRLSIARLVSVRRPIWLLDEPTSALDASGQSLFASLMRDHLARGGLIIAATHTPLGIVAKELRMGATS